MVQKIQILVEEDKKGIALSDIHPLIESVGWGKNYYETEEKWKRVLERSSYIGYVKQQGKVIAFGRILEDGVMCMFYDVCVHPNYQRQGIGKAVMNHLINKVKDKGYVSVGLFVWEGNKTASEFYNKLGFEFSPAMELKKAMKKV